MWRMPPENRPSGCSRRQPVCGSPGATIWRTGTATGLGYSATTLLYLTAPGSAFNSENVWEQCQRVHGCLGVGDGTFARSDANRVTVPAQHLRDDGVIAAVAACGGSGGAACDATGPGNKVAISIAASDVTLDDPAPPFVNASSGSLTVGSILSGSVYATVQASDVGSGLYALGLDVDGQTVSSVRFPDSGGRCAVSEAPSDGSRAFLWAQPCPPNGAATLQVDTRTIADGYRQLSLYVEDASGNRTVVGSASTLIKNSGQIGPGDPPELRGSPNGQPVSDEGRLTAGFVRARPKRCSRASYRRKHRARCATRVRSITRKVSSSKSDRVAGTLRTPDGAPIVGARVGIVLVPRRGGGAPHETATAITNATGRWSARVKRQMSATVQVQWPARMKDTVPAALVKLTARVRARSSFRLSPKRSIRTGRVLRLSGKLVGRSGTKRGVPIVIQARPGRSWRAVTTVRARRNGTWSARYRVPRQLRGRYVFRALVKPTSSYPYASGKSRSVALRVRRSLRSG